METFAVPGKDPSRRSPIADRPSPDDFLSRFDALRPGETLVIETAADPSPHRAALQARRAGRFEWSPDLEGPPRWRTTVARRTDDAGGLRSITEALGWDHDRLEALEREAFAARDRGELAEAVGLFDAFARGLDRNIGFEEALLFPAFESASGHPTGAGPTAVMREEHRRIRSLLAEIAEEIGDPSASPADRRRSLAWVMEEHNVKEEQILYPMTDEALGPDAADRLMQEIQAFRRTSD